LYFQDVIFQIDGVNNIIEKLQDGTHPNISGLFDLSHGAGVLPNAWPSVLNNVYCGYAGGLSPDNVIDELRKIEPLVGAKSIWIDAETHLRNADGNFDLTKVQAFLENVSPYVVNSIYEK
jgi:phosphoribosylanthranilate isomerase